MEAFNELQVIDELIQLAQTPDQVAWLKSVIPGQTKDTIKGLQDLAKIAEGEAEAVRKELRILNKQYAEYFSPKQMVSILRMVREAEKKVADEYEGYY